MKVKIPVSWEMCGTIIVEADSVEAALENLDLDVFPISNVKGTEYVDSSFRVTEECAEDIKVLYNSEVPKEEKTEPKVEPKKLYFRSMVFDDFERGEGQWSQICESCVQIHGIPKRMLDDSGSGTCGVEGCWNEAGHYIDFDEDEVTIK